MRYYKDIENLLLWLLWEYLIMPINNDSITLQETLKLKLFKPTCRKLWCLSACKKSTSSLTSFFRYCKDTAKLLFWELWECLIITIKFIVSICSKLSCLSICRKIITHFSLVILQRNSKSVILENLGLSGHTHLKP